MPFFNTCCFLELLQSISFIKFSFLPSVVRAQIRIFNFTQQCLSFLVFVCDFFLLSVQWFEQVHHVIVLYIKQICLAKPCDQHCLKVSF